ncbi:MAG: PAS domain-containing protein [Caldimonas sp.]
MLTELAEPGVMELLPVLAADESVIDFEWIQASPTATLMLGRAGEDLTGRSLRTFFEDSFGERLFEAYKSAIVSGRSEVAKVQVGDLSVLHRVHSARDGVSVQMTSSSAVERMAVAYQAVWLLVSTTEFRQASRVAAPGSARESSMSLPSAEHRSATLSASAE